MSLDAERTSPRRAWLAAALCLAAGVVFWARLPHLWPLARIDAVLSERVLESRARELLARLGFTLEGFDSASWLRVDTAALDYLEQAFGIDETQERITGGLPVFEYRVLLKRRGDPHVLQVYWHPAHGALGFAASVEEDEPGPTLELDAARELAWRAASGELGLDRGAWTEQSAASRKRPSRTDHEFVYERTLSDVPELRERLSLAVAGDEVVSARRSLVVPAQAERAARAAEAPAVALETFGFALLAVAATAAFFVFLVHLRDGTVRLRTALVWPAAVLGCFTAATALDTARLFRAWEPLWPRTVSTLREMVLGQAELIWVLLVLLAVIGAGDALDRASGALRGASLGALARGRLLDRAVALASARGFAVGLVCGAVMAVTVWGIGLVAPCRVSIQPRGFFFYPLNSAVPALTSLLFFTGVALAEELGYRFFGATWLLKLTRRPWIAVIVPGLVYGLTHTRLDFLPPAEPFWARPLVLTLVGCVWGVAFLRYDALTVVLSHLTADLFIFNWPALASGEVTAVATAALTICVPLAPAVLYPLVVRGSVDLRREVHDARTD
jgi:membrane protease YdiL (CAAX protease family)